MKTQKEIFVSIKFFILILVFPLSTTAGTKLQKNYTVSTGLQFGNPAESPDSGYVIWGNEPDSTGIHHRMAVVKLNKSGTPEWGFSYGVQNNFNGLALTATMDGGYALAGAMDSANEAGTMNILLIRIDSLGSILWSTVAGTSLDDWPVSVCETADSGIVVTGSSINTLTGSDNRAYLIKFNQAGNKVWSTQYTKSDGAACIKGKLCSDEGFIITGDLHNPYNILLAKTDQTGNLQWSKSYDSGIEDWVYDVVPTTDRGFAVLGMTKDGDNNTLFKTDPTGNPEWIKKIYNTNGNIVANSLRLDKENGFILSGHVSLAPGIDHEPMLINIGDTGNILWSISTYNTMVELENGFLQTKDSSYLLCTIDQTSGLNETLLYKTGPGGNVPCNLTDFIASDSSITLLIDSGINQVSVSDSSWFEAVNANPFQVNENTICFDTETDTKPIINHDVQIFPNPGTGKFNIKFSEQNILAYKITVFDALGSEIIIADGHTENYRIDLSSMSKGVYYVQISNDSSIVVKKVILQ